MANGKIKFSETQRIEDVIDTTGEQINEYEGSFVEEGAARGFSHQPFIVAVDSSGSMAASASGGAKTKLELCEELVNGLLNNAEMTRMSELEKDQVDMLVLSFGGDDVLVHTPWQPLSQFKGGVSFHAESTTPLYKTIAESIQASRVLRHAYGKQGIEVKRPQIFIYTDGLATDRANRPLANVLAKKYLDHNRAKLFVVLVPGHMSEEDIQIVSNDLLSLSESIVLLRAKDCENGLPASFSFLASSVVVGQSSAIDDEMNVKYDTTYLGVDSANVTAPGHVSLGKQITFK